MALNITKNLGVDKRFWIVHPTSWQSSVSTVHKWTPKHHKRSLPQVSLSSSKYVSALFIIPPESLTLLPALSYQILDKTMHAIQKGLVLFHTEVPQSLVSSLNCCYHYHCHHYHFCFCHHFRLFCCFSRHFCRCHCCFRHFCHWCCFLRHFSVCCHCCRCCLRFSHSRHCFCHLYLCSYPCHLCPCRCHH